MNRAYLLVVLLFILSSCGKVTTNNEYEKNTDVAPGDNTVNSAVITEITPSKERGILHNHPKYLVKNEGQLSIQDSKTAYEMCVKALTDYNKAIRNGTDIELDAFIDNENLKQYIQKKIQSQYRISNKVEKIDVGAWEVEYKEDVDGGFIYLKLPAEIHNTMGSWGEVTEFLVRNINDRLVIVDWYDGSKDSYDFLVRGENLTIDNPNIWNESEWVKNINSKQVEFSGTTRH
ncbi:hypothetical protein ACFVAD_18260 [Sutcliffiella sp. NPDC057660]|uniref:hypothetical protein n=1 Tax=Sutcliffiella sp. NPDC057660 TaxID=3346199 RepID=UPI0036B45DC3